MPRLDKFDFNTDQNDEGVSNEINKVRLGLLASFGENIIWKVEGGKKREKSEINVK